MRLSSGMLFINSALKNGSKYILGFIFKEKS
eukprot:CAMPEP_0202976592 /NCGR_PEP_ID=MMETSP1396-20130829/78853_1 /ASSEMBLY_ACC=CAM_ASM_000872 /TAXON_ID= /ORGANISM="Pseudokeronopsis sp., Strain Brazil" /LENGTH=30 /DNA_ID= /DNA_START= /DNA_END= /DNA_ORIENTATION=